MGGFAQGLGQGIQGSQQYLSDIQNRRQQAEMFKLQSKMLQLDTDMKEKQLAAQAALPGMLFKGPDMRSVESQGPGAPVQLPMELSDNPHGTRFDARWGQELKERGPGAFEEGPRPAGGQEPIPGTEGIWANLSPQYQDVAKKVLASQGNDVTKTMAVLDRLTPGIFPKQATEFDLAPDHTRFREVPGQAPVPIATGKPKSAEDKLHVVKGALVDSKGNAIYTAPDDAEKPGKPKDKITEIGGIGYEIGEPDANGHLQLTKLPGQEEKPDKDSPNPLDQHISAISRGKYRTMKQAQDAGEHDLVIQAERTVREQRPLDRAIAVGQAMTQELPKREQAAQDIKLGAPLNPKERTGLLDRKSLLAGKYVRPAPGTSIGEASRGDYVEVSDQQMLQLRNLDKASADMDSMFNLVDPLIKETNWFKAKGQGLLLQGAAMTGKNADAATYLKAKAAASTGLAKAFGGETGVMTDTDITRWTNTMVEFGDTVQVKNAKRKLSNEIRDHAVTAQRRVLAGDDINSVRTDLQQQIQPLFQKVEKIGQKAVAPPVPQEFKHLPQETQERWQQAYMERMNEMGAGQ